jgi:hypothetical protein
MKQDSVKDPFLIFFRSSDLSVKWFFVQMAFISEMSIRSNELSVKRRSFKRCSVNRLFGEKAFGQNFSVKWSRTVMHCWASHSVKGFWSPMGSLLRFYYHHGNVEFSYFSVSTTALKICCRCQDSHHRTSVGQSQHTVIRTPFLLFQTFLRFRISKFKILMMIICIKLVKNWINRQSKLRCHETDGFYFMNFEGNT